MNQTRILIADDHVAVREGIRHMLLTATDVAVCGVAATQEELLASIDDESFSLLLLDLSLGGNNISELLARIHELAPSLRIVVYTMYPEDEFAARLFAEGISGYVTKDSSPEVLIDAIRRVVRGGKYVSPQLAEVLAREAGRRNRPIHEQLSEREMEVLIMTADGKSLKEMGQALGVSLKTVSTYRSRTLQKLGVTSNADLIRYALVNRLTKR